MCCQHFSSILMHGHHVFKVCRWFLIRRADCPSISFLHHVLCPLVNHWLNREDHSMNNLYSLPPLTIVRNFWFFVKFFPNSMSNKLSHHSVPKTFYIALN